MTTGPHSDDKHQAPSRRRILSRGRLAAAELVVVMLLSGGAAIALDGSGGGDNDTATSSDGDRSSPESDAAAPSGSGTGGESDWEKLVPGGDCVCADGSDFAFWERRAEPTKVVLYLEGGGACFDATSCAFTGTGGENDFYNWNVSGENPGLGGGILDFARADNPFAGDMYLGDVTRMGGDSSNLVALIDANEAAIEAAGVVQHSYTAPGTEHGIFDDDTFYEMEVNGVSLVDWIEALLAGEPLDDVHCDQCEPS